MTRLAGALLVALAVLGLGLEQANADTRLVGDSLTVQTFDTGTPAGWTMNARNGRPLHLHTGLVARTSTGATALVIALGSNDVSRRVRNMAADLDAVAELGVCTVVTTVKVTGVTPFYARGQWARHARRWNTAVRASGLHVAEWAPIAHANPSMFVADGLHLNAAGEAAYRALLEDTVARYCPA